MKVIAVGMVRGDLLPPYKESFDPEKIIAFHKYIKSKGKEVHQCRGSEDALQRLLELYKEEYELEVIGSYADLCVAGAVSYALRLDITTHSPENFLFYRYHDSNLESRVKYYNSILSLAIPLELQKKKKGNKTIEFKYEFKKNIHIFIPK